MKGTCTWKVAIAAAALVGTAVFGSAAKADLTLDGQTGLFINPTAEVADQGSAEVQADYQRTSSGGSHANTYGVGIAGGVAEGLELSANYNRHSGSGDHANEWRVGGKYQLLNQADKGFDLAAGLNYGRLSGVDLTHWTAYVAATKTLSQNVARAPITGTLGLRWDRYKAGGSSSKASVYAGANVPLTAQGDFNLVGEIGSKTISGGTTPYAIGVRYTPVNSAFSVGAGIGRTNQAFRKNSLFVQAGYQFGK